MLCPRHPDANNLIGMCLECRQQPNQDDLRLNPNPRLDHQKRGRKPVRGMSLHRGSSRVAPDPTTKTFLAYLVEEHNSRVDAANENNERARVDSEPPARPFPRFDTLETSDVLTMIEQGGYDLLDAWRYESAKHTPRKDLLAALSPGLAAPIVVRL